MATAPKRMRVDKCGKCGGEIKGGNLGRHLKTCCPKDDCCYDCPYCHFMGCRDLAYMIKHCTDKHHEHNWKCKKCGWQFTKDGFFDTDHVDNCLRVTKQQVDLAPELQEMEGAVYREFPEDPLDPPGPDHPMWASYPMDANQSIVERWFAIRQHFDNKKHGVHKYVFRAIGSDVAPFNFEDALLFIYAQEKHAFCFNIAEDCLLHKQTDSQDDGDYMAWIAQNGQNFAFENNILVHDLPTLKDALDKMGDVEMMLMEGADRPGSEWVYVGPMSYTFFVYERPSFMLGKTKPRNYPKALAQNKAVISLLKDKNNNYYDDTLCLFRGLCCHFGLDYDNKEEVWTMYEKYRRHVNGPWWWEFPGLPMKKIPVIENIFNINIKLCLYQEDGNHILLRKPMNVNRTTMSGIINKW